jgi:hypothetical protein
VVFQVFMVAGMKKAIFCVVALCHHEVMLMRQQAPLKFQ